MPSKLKYTIAVIFVSILSLMDYQFFYELDAAAKLPAVIRQVMHIIVLACIVPIGYYFLKQELASPWLKHLWVKSYTATISLLLVFGFMEWQFQFFPNQFLEVLSTWRQFFTSPLPFLIILLLQSTSLKAHGLDGKSKL